MPGIFQGVQQHVPKYHGLAQKSTLRTVVQLHKKALMYVMHHGTRQELKNITPWTEGSVVT